MNNKCLKCEPTMNSDNSTSFGDYPKPKKSRPSNEGEGSHWAHLPSIVLHEIFDLLDKKDRQNASSVCRNWRQNLFHPKWWPTVTFDIESGNIEKAKFFTSVFGKIATNTVIRVNTLDHECTDEFIALVEVLSENNNLKELIIEPTHCHFDMSRYHRRCSYDISHVIKTLKRCLPNLNKFSIGCVEDFSHSLDEYLNILSNKQAQKVTHLGLASVKDVPNEYETSYFNSNLIEPFTELKVLSVDFEQLSDNFLSCLENSKQLERLIVHVHGIHDGHVSTSDSAWHDFKKKHPKCELRLTVIHAYEEIRTLHETVLRSQMPLTHLKVFFCESVNIGVLEFLYLFYAETLRSVVWVDSLSNSKASRTFTTSLYDNSPDPLVMMSWLCKNLEELVFYGYKYCEENLIAIARLRGEKLKKLEVSEEDILLSDECYSNRATFLTDIPLQLKRCWAPTKTAHLHPVICSPTAGDSDEYLLPIVLADLH